jgi:hypothetical protein
MENNKKGPKFYVHDDSLIAAKTVYPIFPCYVLTILSMMKIVPARKPDLFFFADFHFSSFTSSLPAFPSCSSAWEEISSNQPILLSAKL